MVADRNYKYKISGIPIDKWIPYVNYEHMTEHKLNSKTARQQRAETIVALLASSGETSVGDLAGHFGVSGMTIRRDLSSLESRGLVTRTHGGCVLRSPLANYVDEQTFDEKTHYNQLQKNAIAHAALEYIPIDATVYLDTGTTAVQVARQISNIQCTVFTNNLCAALELFGKKGVETIMFGGSLARNSPELHGESAIEHVSQYSYDLAILGSDALNIESGELFSADLATAFLSRAAQARSERVLVTMDSSKIQKTSLSVIRTFQPGDILITDTGLSLDNRIAIERMGVKVLTVSSKG